MRSPVWSHLADAGIRVHDAWRDLIAVECAEPTMAAELRKAMDHLRAADDAIRRLERHARFARYGTLDALDANTASHATTVVA